MMHMHIPEAKSPRAQLLVIAGKFLLVLVIVALVVASIVQQHNQGELRRAQHAAERAQIDADRAHNTGACGMRKLTKTLIDRTKAAIARPSTRPQDKPGFYFAIAAYQALHDEQITIPAGLDCRLVLKP